VSIGEAEKRRHVLLIKDKRGLEKAADFPHAAQGQRLVPSGATTHGEIYGIGILGALARRPPAFRRDKLDAYHAGEPSGDLVLHAEEVVVRLVKPFRPEMSA
jgi:hypothetical protein